MTWLLLACTGSEPATPPGQDGALADDTAAADDTAPDATGTASLVDHALWVLVDAASDPAGEPTADCDPAGVLYEEGVLEVETDECGWATVTQPSRTDVRVGDVVEVLAYHGSLVAEDPSEGWMALWLGDALSWEIRVPIPSAAEVYPVTWTAEADVPAGTPVTLHVDNHGANSWRFAALRRTR